MIWSGMEQTHLLYRFAVDMERVRERSRIDWTRFLWLTWELERVLVLFETILYGLIIIVPILFFFLQ